MLTILGSSLIIVFYGMSFGNVKSWEWLYSVTISLVQDMIVAQPLKIFLIAVLVAARREFSPKTDSQQLKSMHKMAECSEMSSSSNGDRSSRDEDEFYPSAWRLKKKRAAALRSKSLDSVTKELVCYIIFAIIVIYITASFSDNGSFYQHQNLKKIFLSEDGSDEMDTEFSQVILLLKSLFASLYSAYILKD